MAADAKAVRAWLAGLVLALGVLSVVATAVALPRLLLARWRPQLDLRMLREMAEPLQHPTAARALFDQVPAARGTAADFLRAQSPAWLGALRDETAVPAGPGWQVRKAQVERSGVPLAEVAGLLVQAEGHRPPWRAAGLLLEAEGTGGVVRVALDLQRVERAGP
jgi:hypothetical protein